jgi:hypothetical protein
MEAWHVGRDQEISIEEIKRLLPKLSREQILELDRVIHEYLESSSLMRGEQTALTDWEDPEESTPDAEE